MTSLLLKRFMMESSFVAELAEERGMDEAKADVEALVRLLQDIAAHTREAWQSQWFKLARERRVDDFQYRGEQFQNILDMMILAVERMLAVGLPVQAVLSDLEQLRERHKEDWPWFRKEDEEKALAESARGETMSVDDAFAEIAGVSREEWSQRLEERRRRRDQEGA